MAVRARDADADAHGPGAGPIATLASYGSYGQGAFRRAQPHPPGGGNLNSHVREHMHAGPACCNRMQVARRWWWYEVVLVLYMLICEITAGLAQTQ